MDVIASYFHYFLSQSHTNTEREDNAYMRLWWPDFVTKISPFWHKWYVFWMQQRDYPTHLMRYEDLLTNPEPIL